MRILIAILFCFHSISMAVPRPRGRSISSEGDAVEATPVAPSAPTPTPPAPAPALSATPLPLSAVQTLPPPAALATNPSPDPWEGWHGRYKRYIGFESAAGATGIIGRNLVVYGSWNGPWGQEYFVGLDKASDTYTQSSSTTTTGTSQTVVTSQTGSKMPLVLTAGGGVKQRLFQGRWLQIYSGYFGGLTLATATTSPAGTTTTSTPDTTNPSTYSVTETGLGQTKTTQSPVIFAGAKLGSEFYLRWFPNLALGFSAGLLFAYGGTQESTASTSSRSYSVTNGTPGASTPSASSSKSTSSPGFRSTTFGVGGTSFQLNGLFTIRYVW